MNCVYKVAVETQCGCSSEYTFESYDDAIKFVEYAEKQPEVFQVYHIGTVPVDLEGNQERLAVWLEDYINCEDEEDIEDEEEDDNE